MALDQFPKIIANSVPVGDNFINLSIAELHDDVKHIPHIGIIRKNLAANPNSSQQQHHTKHNSDYNLL